MGKNQALSIALILFVIIACVLGGTTYYFKKNADELKIARESAVKALPGKEAEIENLSKEIVVLKSYLGQETATLEDITVQYNQDMKIVAVEGGVPAPAPAPKPEGDAAAEGAEGAEGGDAAPVADAAANPDRPSYLTVINYLNDKIKKQNELTAEIEKLNLQISDLQKQVEDAKTQGKTAGVEETEEKYKTQISVLNQQIEELNGRITSKDTEIKNQIAAKKKVTRESNRQKTENDELKKQNRERADAIAKLEDIKKKSEQPPQESKMGEIIFVNPRGDQGIINLGKKDRLTRGITFSVYEPNNMTEYGLKGTIEVLNVSEDREAEVLIFNTDEADPIELGDVLYTPTWAPGFEEHFAIAGFIDIDRDSKSDLDEVIRLITQNGGVVDAYQKENGTQSGKLSSQTSWIVLGVQPDEKSGDAQRKTYTNMTKAADEFNTKSLQVTDLLRKMGYRPPASAQDFEVRPSTGNLKRVSTGSVSELFSDDEPTQPNRQPPKKSAY